MALSHQVVKVLLSFLVLACTASDGALTLRKNGNHSAQLFSNADDVNECSEVIRGRGSSGVLDRVRSTLFSVGYVGYGEYLAASRAEGSSRPLCSIGMADMINYGMEKVKPTPSAILTALRSRSQLMVQNSECPGLGFCVDLTDTESAAAWPLAALAFIVLPRVSQTPRDDCSQIKLIQEYVIWVFHNEKASDIAADLGFVVLPDTSAGDILKIVNSMTCNGDFLFNSTYPSAASTRLPGGTLQAAIHSSLTTEFFFQTGKTIDVEATSSSGAIASFARGLAPAIFTEVRITSDMGGEVERQMWMVPLFATAVVIIYNQADIRTAAADPLTLTREAVNGIFLGQITSWNDTEIARMNPNLRILGETLRGDALGYNQGIGRQLVRVVRDETSGTTQIFARALGHFSQGSHEGMKAGKIHYDHPLKGSSLPDWPTARSPGSGVICIYANCSELLCGPGFFLDRERETCVSCRENTFMASPDHRIGSCKPCAAHLYAQDEGNKDCHTCLYYKSSEIGGRCVDVSNILASLISSVLGVAAFYILVRLYRKRGKDDNVYLIRAKDVVFADPPQILGVGSFGQVLLGEYHGTEVAIALEKGDIVLRTQPHRWHFICDDDDDIGLYSTSRVKRIVPPTKEGVTSGSSVVDAVNTPLASILLSYQPIVQMDTSESMKDIGELLKRHEREASDQGLQKLANYTKSKQETPEIETECLGSKSRGEIDVEGIAGREESTFDSSRHEVQTASEASDEILQGIDVEQHVNESFILQVPEMKSTIMCICCRYFERRREWSSIRKKHEEFIDEIRLVSKLRHPCITTVMGAIIQKDSDLGPLLVMEHMELGSLSDLLQNESFPFELEIIFPILKNVTLGMRYLHSADPPFVHADLKAANIMIDSHLQGKVADFGLTPKTGSTVGTPYWMAPEMLRGESTATKETDVYAFGILLSEALSRKLPYVGMGLIEVLTSVADNSKDPPLRPWLPPDCPDTILSLIKECWSNEPENRPSFEELDKRIKRWNSSQLTIPSCMVKTWRRNLPDELPQEMYPEHFAMKVKDNGTIRVGRLEGIAIFSATIMGMKKLSTNMPRHAMSELVENFHSVLDQIALKYLAQKIEVQSCMYLAASGLKVDEDQDHVLSLAGFACEAAAVCKSIMINPEDPSMGSISVQIGMHCGPVILCILGKNNRLSLLGKSLITACEVRNECKPGTTLCSRQCAIEISKHNKKQEFVFKRCKVNQQGKSPNLYMLIHKGVGGTSPHSAVHPLKNFKRNPIKSPPLQMIPASLPGTVNMDDVLETERVEDVK